jgi:hypothetical protein
VVELAASDALVPEVGRDSADDAGVVRSRSAGVTGAGSSLAQARLTGLSKKSISRRSSISVCAAEVNSLISTRARRFGPQHGGNTASGHELPQSCRDPRDPCQDADKGSPQRHPSAPERCHFTPLSPASCCLRGVQRHGQITVKRSRGRPPVLGNRPLTCSYVVAGAHSSGGSVLVQDIGDRCLKT